MQPSLVSLITRNIKSYTMKTLQPFTLETKYKSGEVVTGAHIYLSIADARALYHLTTPAYGDNEEDNELQDAANTSALKGFVKQLAERILFTDGPTTSRDSLLSKFNKPEFHSTTVGKIPID